MKVELESRRFSFRAPVATAYGELREREVLLLTLDAGDGLVGTGEAAPLEPYDGVSLGAVRDALQRCRPLLEDATDVDREELVDACWLEAGLPQAVAAIDVALWDLEARRAGRPLAALLAPSAEVSVRVNASVTAVDRAGAASEAAAAVEAGFRCLKLKVGVGDDAGRVAAVRAVVGPDVELRIDANGAWTVDEAVAALAALSPADLELVEEPVHGVEALRAVRQQTSVPVVMDETASDPSAPGAGAADGVCLKLAACGGPTGLLAAAEAARAAGSFVYVASTYDGQVGIAAGLHTAAALAASRACGLATLSLFADLADPFPPRDGAIAVPPGPGLGAWLSG